MISCISILNEELGGDLIDEWCDFLELVGGMVVKDRRGERA